MKIIGVILPFLSVFKLCLALDQIRHSYQHDVIHKNRQELVITNVTTDDKFRLNSVKKWKSLCVEKTCYLAGLMEKNVSIALLNIDSEHENLTQATYTIDFNFQVVDLAVFEFWNSTLQNFETILVIATDKPELIWYKISNSYFQFWSWTTSKKITHINLFQMEYDYHILVIGSQSADLYQLDLEKSPQFWLRQKIKLNNFTESSAVSNLGPYYFLSFPQNHHLSIYKFSKDHFIPYQNITSKNINEVVSFSIHQKSFIAFNGLNAGIYQFTKNGLVRENILETHAVGVNFWLPTTATRYGNEAVLIAQRSLKHGPHKSFVIELITYNGDKFEEHEDIPCYYFGEEILGLSCLLDEDFHEGIKGSTFFSLNDVLAVVVPKHNRSELYLIETKIKKVANPLIEQIEEFRNRQKNLTNLMLAQEETFNNLRTRQNDNSLLDEIESNINNMPNILSYDTIIFNGLVKIEKSGSFDTLKTKNINGESAETLFQDIALKNTNQSFTGKKVFKNLETENLLVKKINSVNTKDLLYSSQNITFNDDLFLTKPLNVSELKTKEINGFLLNEKITNFEIKNLIISEKTEVDSLTIIENLKATNVNGEPFAEFLSQLCLKNINNYIPSNFTVEGDVTILENAEIETLNDLPFPSDYIFTYNSIPFVTGVKNFNYLSTTELNLKETVDGIFPSSIITLKSNQNITGTTTFRNLKITESLNVNGKTVGEHASKFLSNPTLLNTDVIRSKAHFKNLKVEGAIIISDKFNGENLERRLEDIIYRNEDKVIIEAMKEFPEGFTVRKNFAITSKSVNNISLDEIITKNTDQTLNLTTINGVVTFGNVQTQLYDNFDVKKLDEELVKLDGEQYISSTLIFEDEIDINKLEIIKNLTKFELSQNVFSQTDAIENIIVEGNLYGKINGFDLTEFDKSRLSFSKDQEIKSTFSLENCFAKNFDVIKINGIDLGEIGENLLAKIANNKIEIKNLNVTESVDIDRINNESVMNLEGSLWKYGVKKHKLNKLIFKDNVFFENLEIEKLSNVSLKKYVENIVFKNETDVKLTGGKVFLKGFSVKKLMEIKKLNTIALPNILNKYGKQEIMGSFTIVGNVNFDNVTISQHLNDNPIEIITNSYNMKDDYLHVQGDVIFNRMPHVRNLEIEGLVNGKKVSETLESIIYKNQDVTVSGSTIFENFVNIDKNIRVNGQFNGVDFLPFVSDMILITKDQTIISPLKFNNIQVYDQIVLNSALNTTLVNNFDINSWMDKAVFIDKGLLSGKYSFENIEIVDNLETEKINNVKINTLIPLRSDQELPEMNFEEVSVFRDVHVGNSTNFYNLPEELANTVMVNSEQVIESEINFIGKVYLEGDCQVKGTLNDIKTDKIVTTNTEQELRATYNFRAKSSLNNLIVKGLVNGIDVEKWANESIKTSSRNQQNITDNWTTENLIFEENCTGSALINNLNLEKFSREVQEKRNYKYQVEKGFIDDYINICKDLTYMHNKLKKQIYKFDYMEKMAPLIMQRQIEFVFSYNFENNNYLIVNERKNCDSHIFILESEFRFFKTVHFGLLAQVVSVKVNGGRYFVTRNRNHFSLCKFQGTNLWQLLDFGFKSLANIEDQDLLQESLEIATFYGLRGHTITEFKVSPNLDTPIWKYRKWTIVEENVAFVPRGFGTGLSVQTGRKLIKLNREDSVEDRFSEFTEEIIVGNYSESFNSFFPGRKDNDLAVIKVGMKSSERTLLAVASHEETSVKGSLDFIKIYEDVISGKLFHKVATYKPSSLTALEFENGESMLAFMEDGAVLQVYEYKGIEGFKHKLSAKMEGSKLFAISKKDRKIIGVVDKNRINFMEIVMLGTQVEKNLKCTL